MNAIDIQFSLVDILMISPLVALFLASLIPLTIKVLKGNREPNPFATMCYGLVGIVLALGLAVATRGVESYVFQRALIFDGISHISSWLVLLVTAAGLIFSRENTSTLNRQYSEQIFLILNAAIGMLVFVWSNDLIVTFVGLELMSLCLYVLIALSTEEQHSKESAFKYFLLGSFASAFFLYGLAFIYGTVGSTYLPEISQYASTLATTNRLFLVGIVLLLAGVLFKVSVFPFHAWTPDVYQGAPTPITAFMAAGVKAVGLAFVLRVFSTEVLMVERSESLIQALEWLAVPTMLIGNLAALWQSSLKRMLAYSSISNAGFVFMGLISAGVGGESLLAASGVMFYVLAYAIVTIGTFGVVSYLEYNEKVDITLDHLKGLCFDRPFLSLTLAICLLSLAGIPPTAGFFGKLFIFSAALKQGFFWMVFWAVISSVIGVYFYLRPIVHMYMMERDLDLLSSGQPKPLSQFVVALSALAVVGLGLFADPVYQALIRSISGLF